MTSDLDYRWQDATAADYASRRQQFECAQKFSHAEPGTVREKGAWYYPWQLEVQKHVRSRLKSSRYMKHDIIVDNRNGKIYGYVFYGYFIPKTSLEGIGFYTIGFIARSLDAQGCHLGGALLKRALTEMRKMQEKHSDRDDLIVVHIHPENMQSRKLFSQFGFERVQDDDIYEEWVKFGFDF